MVARALSVVAIISLSACIVGDEELDLDGDIPADIGELSCADDEVVFIGEDGEAWCGSTDDIEEGADLFDCLSAAQTVYTCSNKGYSFTACKYRGGRQYCGRVTFVTARKRGGHTLHTYRSSPGGMCTN